MKKLCKNCGNEYISNYNKSKYCSSKCKKIFLKNKNKKNRQKEDSLLRWTKKIKAINKLGCKCKNCGDNNIHHLVFHHLNPEYKENNISKLWTNRWSDIEKEINKCVLLCDNCHRELHYNEKTQNTKDVLDRRKSKEVLVTYNGNKCEKCGYDKCFSALTFHHINKENKDYAIGVKSIRITNIAELNDDILNELDKCELLCSNCHRDAHIDISDIDIKKIEEKISTYKETNKKLDKEKIFKLYFDENVKAIEITKMLKCSKSSISTILKNEKIKRNKTGEVPKLVKGLHC